MRIRGSYVSFASAVLLGGAIVSPVALAQRSTPVTVVNTPLPVTIDSGSSCEITNWEFVGFSSDTINGNVGLFPKTELCQADFPGSRVCTTRDILNTVNPPPVEDPIGTWGWVRGVVVAVDPNNNLVDYFGTRAAVFECKISTQEGLAVAGNGFVGTQPCGTPIAIACCLP